MILFLFILAALGFFYHRVLDQPGRPRTIGSLATGLVIIVAVLAIAANDLWHVGMHTQTTTQTTTLVGNQVAAVAIGSSKQEHAYRVTLATGEPRVVKPGLTATTTLRRGPKAKLETSTKRLRFNNAWAAILFAGSGLQNKRLATHTIVIVPDSWRVVQR